MQVERENLRLIAMPHVLSTEKGRIDVMRPAGGNVNDLMRSIGWTPDRLSARVFIDGEYVEDASWEYTVPRAGQSVIVRAIPMGGGCCARHRLPDFQLTRRKRMESISGSTAGMSTTPGNGSAALSKASNALHSAIDEAAR
ncbi:MAG: hypothetical protein H7Y39_02270, partial [Nitrospiraceae bacterium]|nr:hypothetical protein [Nitrospiraceae bacterium]